MSFSKRSKGKWLFGLFSCLGSKTRSVDLTDCEHPYSELRHTVSGFCPLSSHKVFEVALRKESLLYLPAPENGEPVLNLCLGFSDKELGKKRPVYLHGLHSNRNDFLLAGLEKVVDEVYFDEPVIDGLPASLWLECIEPTLSVLTSLSSLKHRRSNLSIKRPRPSSPDSQYNRHGDFEFGPVALYRRPTMRLDLDLLDSLNSRNSLITVQPINRTLNRRRQRRPSFDMIEELNTNQSANTSTETMGENRVLSQELISNADLEGDDTNIAVEANAGDTEDEENYLLSILPEFSDTRELIGFLFDCTYGEEDVRQRALDLISQSSYVDERRIAKEIRPNITYIFQPSFKKLYKNTACLYTWNANVRFFSCRTFPNYRLKYMKWIKAGMKCLFIFPEEGGEYAKYASRLSRFVTSDHYSRRLMMVVLKDYIVGDCTLDKRSYSESFLTLSETVPIQNERLVIRTISPIPETAENEGLTQIRRIAKGICDFFRRCLGLRESGNISIAD